MKTSDWLSRYGWLGPLAALVLLYAVFAALQPVEPLQSLRPSHGVRCGVPPPAAHLRDPLGLCKLCPAGEKVALEPFPITDISNDGACARLTGIVGEDLRAHLDLQRCAVTPKHAGDAKRLAGIMPVGDQFGPAVIRRIGQAPPAPAADLRLGESQQPARGGIRRQNRSIRHCEQNAIRAVFIQRPIRADSDPATLARCSDPSVCRCGAL